MSRISPILGSPTRTFGLGMIATALVLTLSLTLSAGQADAAKNPFKLVKPRKNAKVKGKTKVKVSVAKALKKNAWGVEFWVDGQRVATDRKAPYSSTIDTRKLSNGQHLFRANVVVKAKGGKKPDRTKCGFLRASYVYVKNKKSKGPTATSKLPVPTPIATTKKKWKMSFRDEFGGTALDFSKWNNQRDDWMKGGNPYNDREGAWYKPENTTVSGGNLIQTVKAEIAGDLVYEDHLYDRTTGIVNSHQRFGFQYGYVEARVSVPSCAGCWPVFWTLPTTNTWPPEVDMFEYLDTASSTRRPFVASHWKDDSGLQTALYYYTSPCGTSSDYTNSFHTYGYLWTPTKIQPFLDGVPGPVITGAAVPHVAMYLVLMLSTVDKDENGQPFNTPDGAQMITDYVRVWQTKHP